jgi:hypothetical protein
MMLMLLVLVLVQQGAPSSSLQAPRAQTPSCRLGEIDLGRDRKRRSGASNDGS